MRELFFRENIFDVLDYVDDAIQIIDDQGRIIYFNRAVQNLDGVEREKVIGRHVLEIYPSLSYDTSTLLEVIQTGEPIFNVEQNFLNYKGDKITTINSSIPIKANGKIKGALEISKDITHVKALSEQIVDLQKALYKDEKHKTCKECDNGYYTFVDIIGQSKGMIQLKSLALKAAQIQSPVLVYGETGTGKELVVQSIHSAGPRKNKPFIVQNCAALPASLLEGILFGTVKGGFTGAEDRPGLFELADGGTLFLDEINSMPLELQAKLLRVLEDGSIRRVGSTKTNQVNVRIITAINVLPEDAIDDKSIRKDLFYRLNVINLNLPPLRERKGDIELLVDHFIHTYNERFDRKVLGITDGVKRIFEDYSWPGNVRELKHLLEALISMHEGDYIDTHHLPRQFKTEEPVKRMVEVENTSLKLAVEELEKTMILQAYSKADKNISQTADYLDLPRQTLQYKLKKYSVK